MPTSSLTGKSKEDLATIAAVSGLLSREQALAMTKTNLLKYLKNAETAAQTDVSTEAESSDKTGKKPKARTRKTAARKKATAQSEVLEAATQTDGSETVETVSEPQPSESSTPTHKGAARRKVKGASVGKHTEASKATSAETSTDGPTEETRVEPVEVAPDASSSTAASASEDQTFDVTPKRRGRQKSYNQVDAGKSTKHTPARNDRKTAAAGKGKGPRQTSAATSPATNNKRPMRVKVFGIPANSMADQTDEIESVAASFPNEDLDKKLPQLPVETAPVEMGTELESKLNPSIESPAAESMLAPAQVTSDTSVTTAAPEAAVIAEPIAGEREPVVPAGYEKLNRKQQIESGESITGVLEVMPDGYGFLRRDNYLQGAKDAYVPPQYIRRFNLRPGDLITGPCKKQRDNDRYQALLYIKEVNGQTPDKMIRRPHFDRLTPIYPDERFVLETVRNELSTRIIDLVAPIGKGQRGMIVSPPKAGKTILLQKIANAISTNNPDAKLIVLLIDERPEEVTDMQRSINGEVVFSTFDKTPENHVKVTELVLERAMRLVELKQDVIILLDSMTRLARAYNLTITPTGRTLSGGLDPGALYGPKRFFGAARNIENGGSLTIIATSLIETGSRMDEVIFEEFKGTGNMEVYLDRKLSEKRIFPAIDINRSGTRREELLLTNKELDAVWTIRKAFGQLDTAAVTETIINLLLKTQNNQQFISSINVSFNDKNVFDAMRGTRPGQANGNQGAAGGLGNQRRNFERDDD